MVKIARVIVTFDCPRRGINCCNTYQSIISKAKHVASVAKLYDYDQIIITGGEPMLYPGYVVDFARHLKRLGKTAYLYTALYHPKIKEILPIIDGVQYTLHAPLPPGETLFVLDGMLNRY